jgi:hypothetical protein
MRGVRLILSFSLPFLFLYQGMATAQTDPEGNLDSAYLVCGTNIYPGSGTTQVTFHIWYKSDNTGTNKIAAIAMPLVVTGSNIVSVDTTVSLAFAGSGVAGFTFHEVTKVGNSDPTVPPFKVFYGAANFTGGITGESLFANVTVTVNDGGTICIDTFNYPFSPTAFITENADGFKPGWVGGCCSVLDCGLCGDVNGSGNIAISDFVMLSDFLYGKGPLFCPDYSDVDAYDSITIRDFYWVFNRVFSRPGCGGWPFTCPPSNPPLQPTVLVTDTLKVIASMIPAGESTVVIYLEYKNVDSLNTIVLPLKFLVGEEIPVIDTVVGGPRFPGTAAVDSASGRILFFRGSPAINFGPGSDTMMRVDLSIQPAAFSRGVSIDTTGFPPTHYHPLFLDLPSTCYSPVFPVFCPARPGDANADGSYSLADVISIVNYIFNKPGCSPQPLCWISSLLCRGDWDGSGTVSLSDVIRAVNYIFNKPSGPWNALPVGACCLP